MKNLINYFVITRRQLIVEEKEVLEVISVINHHYLRLANQNLVVANCGWADRSQWFINFDASGNQWTNIVSDLIKKKFTLGIKELRTDCIYLTKKD